MEAAFCAGRKVEMSRKVLGLEIREESIAAVLLEAGFKGSEVQAQGIFPISQEHEGDEGIIQALQSMADTLKPMGATCILGIPVTAISFRNICVPFHDNKKIRQILPFELEPSLPVPVDDLIIDFEAVKRDGNKDLLTFTVPKERIQWYFDILDAVSLNPVVITPAGYAATRILASLEESDDDFLFIDGNLQHHTIYAVSQKAVRLVRTLPVHRGSGMVLNSLGAAMTRTLTALKESHGIALEPARIYAPSAHRSFLVDGLADGGDTVHLLQKSVESMDSIRAHPRLKIPSDQDVWQSGQLDIALALALMESESIDGINFSTKQSAIQRYWNEFRGRIIATGTLILVTIFFLIAGQVLSVAAKKREVAELDRQIEMVFKSTFPEVTRIVEPLQQMRIKIQETTEANIGPDLPGSRVRVIDILDTLSKQIPSTADVKITRMVMGIDNVVLSGNTDTFNTVDDIKGKLEEAQIFTGATISSADMEKSGKRVRFKIKLDF